MADNFEDKLWEDFTKDIKKLNVNYYHLINDIDLRGHKKIVYTQDFSEYLRVRTFHINNFSISKDEQPNLRYQSPVKLKRPQILGRLDLHGLNQQAAYEKLCQFIIIHYERQQRSLLVITGKGKRVRSDIEIAQGGILQMMLPQWLESIILRPFIVHYCTAAPQDGGNGAFYIKLRNFKNYKR